MVSKAREDLPEPESPVTTVRVLRGMLTSTLRRLCWRAPRTVMCVMPMYVVWRCSAKTLGYGILWGGIKRGSYGAGNAGRQREKELMYLKQQQVTRSGHCK